MKTSDLRIISIDDNPINLVLIESYGKILGVEVESFSNPLDAVDAFLRKRYDLVLVDYMMPEIDGLEVIRRCRASKSDTPIVMITAAGDDKELMLKALELGATDFLSKPINASEFKARISNLLNLRISQLLLESKALLLQDEVAQATAAIVEREHDALMVLGKTAEYKDPETGAHIARVAHYSKMMAREYGLGAKEQDIIFYASPFHDIGKVGIPDHILLKPGKLDDDEFAIMKRHTTIGYEILKESKSLYLRTGADIAISHHEKWDGSGYPKRVAGKDIHLYGRIVAIVDVFDALTSNRPYKSAWEFDDALNLIMESSGTHFDPELVDLFMKNIEEIWMIKGQIKGS